MNDVGMHLHLQYHDGDQNVFAEDGCRDLEIEDFEEVFTCPAYEWAD